MKRRGFDAVVLTAVMLCSCTGGEKVPVVVKEQTSAVEAVVTIDTEKDEGKTVYNLDINDSNTETAPQTTAQTEIISFREPDSEKFTERLNKIYSDYGITGMSVALFGGGRIIHTENIGYFDRETKTLCTDNTRYRIASTSKLISTMVVMTLCDNGSIELNSNLSDVTGIKFDSNNKKKIKLRHLMTHTAGIIDTYIYERAVTSKFSIDYILSTAHNGYEPGEIYNYSNFGAGSMGAVVESVTGEFFHDYADKALFEPLGMDAGYLIDLIDDKESCATLYDYDGEVFHVPTWKRNRNYYESFGLGNSYMTAQCELIISASDLARLGIVLAGDGTLEGKTVLSEASVEAINKSYISTPSFDMGLNVRIYDNLIDGRIMYGHPGNALGAITGLYYDRTDGTGVAFLTNRCAVHVDENGFYRAIKDTINAAYECYLR